MILSFDLDDTLIISDAQNTDFFSKILRIEKLRNGTKELFVALKKNNHKIYIYTTSYRSKFYIKLLFLLNGISLNYIINKQRHDKFLGKNAGLASKMPNYFGIDLHFDDSKGVALEGEKYGFSVFVIDRNDKDWVKNVLNRIILTEIIY